MSFRYLDIELNVRTATREASYAISFTNGLNIVQARNSWGKSTLIQSLVYGLGLEGAFSVSHLSPLGEAMTSVIDLDGQREAIVESSVRLTLENDRGEQLRVKRFPRSLEYDDELVQTWEAGVGESLEEADRRDMFVRQSGGATHELGFHRLLEAFLGFDLPDVPGYNADEVKLYLEVLFPLFYVEQKYGWSGLAPRVPTQFRIRAPYRRAAEFALGLGTLERLREREATSARLSEAKAAWADSKGQLRQLVLSQGWEFRESDSGEALIDEQSPFGLRQDEAWVTAEEAIVALQDRLRTLEGAGLLTVGESAAASRARLAESEREVAQLAGRYRALSETAAAADSELVSLEIRHRELEHARETLIDVRKLERLGSEIDAHAVAGAHCPTCSQALDSALVASGIVMDVSANLALLDAERQTLQRMVVEAAEAASLTQARANATRSALDEARGRVRTLKDELTSPSGSPSVAQIEERLETRAQLRKAEAALARGYSILEEVNRSARAIATLQEHLRGLRGGDDQQDAGIVRRFSSRFVDALSRFGLRSLPVTEVKIGSDSLLPEHGGFELTFDIQHGLSASDAIRTKWAHYIAMADTSARESNGSPLGILILDEPRQQEAEFESVKALYAELSEVGYNTQVIVASSAHDGEMSELIEGIEANLIANQGTHMFSSGVPVVS